MAAAWQGRGRVGCDGATVFLSSHAVDNGRVFRKWLVELTWRCRFRLGVAAFYGACRVMGVTDLDLAFQAVLAPVKRRLPETQTKVLRDSTDGVS